MQSLPSALSDRIYLRAGDPLGERPTKHASTQITWGRDLAPGIPRRLVGTLEEACGVWRERMGDKEREGWRERQ